MHTLDKRVFCDRVIFDYRFLRKEKRIMVGTKIILLIVAGIFLGITECFFRIDNRPSPVIVSLKNITFLALGAGIALSH